MIVTLFRRIQVNAYETDTARCQDFLSLPLIRPTCTQSTDRIVPRIYHAFSDTAHVPTPVQLNAEHNREYRLNYHNDASAYHYVAEHCGRAAAEAFRCFVSATQRAEVFRACALSAEGGVYLDVDVEPMGPLTALYSPCAHATVGYDYPQVCNGVTVVNGQSSINIVLV